MKAVSRCERARKILLFWCLFVGIGAVAGSIGMLSDPTGRAMGMDAMLPYFQKLPLAQLVFQDFRFPGIALLVVNGLSNLTAAGFLLRRKKTGLLLGMIFGITLMLWICIQFYMFPMNFLSTAYFIFGLAQAATGYAALVFFKQESFVFRPEEYPRVGTNPAQLVVYFSRMGYTRKLAYEMAQETGAAVYEIVATEKTAGTAGFWWCGRYGMHGWAMPIAPVTADLTAYERVSICASIWVLRLCGPIRQFCRESAGKIRQADYLLVHHTAGAYENAVREMDTLLGLTHTRAVSVVCRKGVYTRRTVLDDTPAIRETAAK